MKKLLATFIVFFALGISSLYAGFPESSNGSGLDPDYGGMLYSTSSFSFNGATVTGRCIVNGVIFSSGLASDFVTLYNPTTTVTGLVGSTVTLHEVMRIYNVAGSTGGVSGANSSAGFNFAGNMRFRNLVWKPSSDAYHRIAVILWRPDTRKGQDE